MGSHATGVSPECVILATMIYRQEKIDMRLGDPSRYVTQSSKDKAYLQLALGIPARDERDKMRLKAHVASPIGVTLKECPGCDGLGAIEVPDPNNRDSATNQFWKKAVSCPSCDGHGWVQRTTNSQPF